MPAVDAATSGVTELDKLIPKVWSSRFYEELRNQLVLGSIFSREYEGEIKEKGDTVKVNQIVSPTGEILTSDKVKFTSEQMVVNQFEVKADKRASASFILTDLALLQSEEFMLKAQEALVYSIMKQIEGDLINTYRTATLASALNPTAASDYAAVDIGKARTNLSKKKVPKSNRFMVLSPDYYGDLLTKNQIISSDFVEGKPFQDQEIKKVLGFKVLEHDLLADDTGMAFHDSVLQFVMQQGLRIKISDRHAQNEYSYLMSADIVFGNKVFDANRGLWLKEA